MAAIILDRVDKAFANGQFAVRDLSLTIDDGELMVLVGPSGSGKSTVLRLIAGLESPSSGRVLIGERDVTTIPPQGRDLAMVFQSYALYPHKTVRENLAFGLRLRGVKGAVIDERVSRTAAALGIEPLLARKPAQLSGGQRQRVALGRAIVREPQAFLLDEPLSNLDPLLRVETRAELALLHRRLRTTMVYVTHDQEEAMTLGSRVAVMRDGTLEQLGPPMHLFRAPANLFVARFIGSPAMNILACTWSRDNDRTTINRGRFSVAIGAADAHRPAGEPVLLGVRPHEIQLAAAADADGSGRVEIVEALGATTLVHVRIDEAPDGVVRVLLPSESDIGVDQEVHFRVRREALHLFAPATGLRLHLTSSTGASRLPAP